MTNIEKIAAWCHGVLDSVEGEFRMSFEDREEQSMYDEGYDYGIELQLKEQYGDNS